MITASRRVKVWLAVTSTKLWDDHWQRRLAERPWPKNTCPRLLVALIREYLFVSRFCACAESLASENASRLATMQRADKNIDEVLEKLDSTYHRLRQNGIDEELFDVISGFEVLSNVQRGRTS